MEVVLLAWFLLAVKFAAGEEITISSDDLHNFGEIQKVPDFEYAPVGAKICMKELGCFEITKDFYKALVRPVNMLPQDRATIATKFVLFTKEHPKENHDLMATEDDEEEIEEWPIDPTHRTVFLVHGFFDSRLYGKWIEDLKDNILLNSDFNVIAVDWSKGNTAPYTRATANTRVVGAEIALLIQKLQKLKGVNPMDCHIIGHSLGSHIAGYAGERLNKTLGRITGLDPAGPYFENMPPSVRLDTTDADFVDVIHTDTSSSKFFPLGMAQAVGHVDFYPNNGGNQPGCTMQGFYSIFLEGLVDATRRFVACHHQRAVDFFTASLNFRRALPVGYYCSNWEDYLEGRCAECGKDGARCAVMGLQAEKFKAHKNDSRSVKMFLATGSKDPFWEFAFQIQVKLIKPKISYTDKNGKILLDVQGSKNNYSLTLKPSNLVHGSTYTFLVLNPQQLGNIKGVKMTWNPATIFGSHVLYLGHVKIMPMNMESDQVQKAATKLYCDKSGNGIKSRKATTLVECPN
ncbi:hypothetical protein JTE90_008471 [Oedothorax gibbosus]|uniref:Lipase domain-containing protein n=1 Tax=Oedothorax gibbosus TaxID=931172 RepID=A0AAV6UZ24_9ARAC|nr:hypothetical protein JTE90_008471 [Oedothorax gibbosus]